MKLVIQIPCYNEEKDLPITLRSLPKKIKGIDEIEVLIIDDGSTDRTIEVAKENGVKSFVKIPQNSGLGIAFQAGLAKALEMGADIIVNTDADNQYCADDIEKLVIPILNKQADIVVGERPLMKIKEWSLLKRFLQKFGTFIVRILSFTDIMDATSGFRALNREAVLRLNFFEKYSHTLETVMQADAKGLILKSIPIRVNANTRKSKLMKNMFHFMLKQSSVILRNFLIYRPFLFFSFISFFLLILGIGLGILGMLFLMTVFLCLAGFCALLSLFAQLIVFNRKILENISLQHKKRHLEFIREKQK